MPRCPSMQRAGYLRDRPRAKAVATCACRPAVPVVRGRGAAAAAVVPGGWLGRRRTGRGRGRRPGRRSGRAGRASPLARASHRPAGRPSNSCGRGWVGRGRPGRAGRWCGDRRPRAAVPGSARCRAGAAAGAVCPARQGAGTTQPRESPPSRRGRARRQSGRAASGCRRAAADGPAGRRRGEGDAARCRPRRPGRHRAPCGSFRRRRATQARTRPEPLFGPCRERSARAVSGRRAPRSAVTARPGCSQARSPAQAGR
jgi:hypothetical protein